MSEFPALYLRGKKEKKLEYFKNAQKRRNFEFDITPYNTLMTILELFYPAEC